MLSYLVLLLLIQKQTVRAASIARNAWNITDIDTFLQSENGTSVSEDYPIDYGEYGKVALDWLVKNVENLTETNEIPSGETSNSKVVTAVFHHNMTRDEVRSLQGQIMSGYMNLSADPCSDFYDYVCGNWAPMNPIPDDSTGFDTFEKLRQELLLVLKGLLEAEVDSQEGEAIAKVKKLYASCMDEATLESRKEKPLLALLEQLGGWPMISSDWNSSSFHWVDLMARLRQYNNDIFVSMWIGPDGKNSENHIVQLDQGDLGLPSREYYVLPGNGIVLTAYADLIRGAAFALGGKHQVVDQDVRDLIDFETELAKIIIPNEERRNITALYKKVTIAELDKTTPTIQWSRYMSIVLDTEAKMNETVVLYAGDYLYLLAELIQSTKPRIVANYLLWRFIRHRMNNLDQRFQNMKQDLYAVLYGRKQQPDRWKNCATYVNGNMGMAVGSLFVRRFFSEASKNDTVQLTAEIQQVFQEILEEVDWLDADTKLLALKKLTSVSHKIGYPDYIVEPELLDEEFERLTVKEGEFFENVLRMLRFTTYEELQKLREPVDRNQWTTSPAVVNAYYSRTKNQIMVPAGILQPPFYHAHFPKALNYGGIGVVIGHEITHGFDDQGRQFDIRGNLEPWWPEEAIANFQNKTRCIIEQYGNYTVPEVQMQVNGINTQGENIADNGGVRQAFRAYMKWLNSGEASVRKDEYMPGLKATPKQLFFINFGQIWCGATRPEAMVSNIRTAVHAPGRFRVIGPLSNLEEFSQAFQCPEGSAMNPVKRCTVW